MLITYNSLWKINMGDIMAVTQIDIDEGALDQVLALSKVRTKKDAVNLALRYYAERQERAARIGRHFERAQDWGAVEDAERLHRAEKEHG
jgi:Arc/MetJ family transcription regulator